MSAVEELEAQLAKVQAVKAQVPPGSALDLVASMEEQCNDLSASIAAARARDMAPVASTVHMTSNPIVKASASLSVKALVIELESAPKTEENINLLSELKGIDLDGDGLISITELTHLGRTSVKQKKQVKNLKKYVAGLCLACIIFFGVMLALMVGAIEATKDSKPEKQANSQEYALRTIDGHDVTTNNPSTLVPLGQLASMPKSVLLKLKDITVETADGSGTMNYKVSAWKLSTSEDGLPKLEIYTFINHLVIISDNQVEIIDQSVGSEAPYMARRALLSKKNGYGNVESHYGAVQNHYGGESDWDWYDEDYGHPDEGPPDYYEYETWGM